jgi:hypothetical protein
MYNIAFLADGFMLWVISVTLQIYESKNEVPNKCDLFCHVQLEVLLYKYLTVLQYTGDQPCSDHILGAYSMVI